MGERTSYLKRNGQELIFNNLEEAEKTVRECYERTLNSYAAHYYSVREI